MNISYTTTKRKYSYCLLAIILLLMLFQTLTPVLSQGEVDAVDDSYNLLNNEDAFFDAPALLANDTSGVTIVASDTSTTLGGTITINSDGSWSVSSPDGFVGSTSFTYTIDDGTGAQDTATVYLNYEAPPVVNIVDAVDDSYNLLNNEDAFFDAPALLANDTSGVTIVASDTSAALGGTITINSDGSWSVSSPNGFVGSTSFTYTIDDGTGAQDTATVYLNYEAPVITVDAVDDSYTLFNNQDSYFDVPGMLVNDSTGATIVASEISTLFDGTGYVNSDGGWYVPSANGFLGAISFTYTIADNGGAQDTATVYLNYELPIVAEPDFFTTQMDTPLLNANVLTNDSGTDLTVTTSNSDVPDLFVEGNGNVNYTPAAGFVGTASFTYEVADSLGNVATGSATITVEAVDPPSIGCEFQTQIPESECDALVNLYNSTNGAGWTNNTDWTMTNSPCGWYGIYCEEGHLIEILLNSNNLSGTLPALPSSLIHMQLTSNNLTGSIPALPPSLVSLYLSGNQLTGSIPALPASLKNLELSGNQLTGTIAAIPASMVMLRLFGNQLTGTIPALPASLESLELSSNQLTGTIPALPASLLSLSLANNRLTGSIPALPASLESLIIRSNQLTGTIPSLPASLLALGLSDNQLTGTIPPLPPSLQDLSLRDNQLSGPIPALPPTLYFLWLHNNQLSGEIPTSITSTAIVAGDNLRLCGGTNDLYSSDAAVNAFVEALKPGWSPLNRCIAVNQPPTANAGDDQTVSDSDGNGTQAVTFNGSLSVDPDGSITTYSWSDSENGFEIATGVAPTLNLSVGIHTITLTVTDNRGEQATDTVTVEIAANQPPTANAGADQTLTDSNDNRTESVSLDGSLSADPDGSIMWYAWSQNNIQIATGVSPIVTIGVGTHVITLTVTDNVGGRATDTVMIEVLAGLPLCVRQTEIPESECNILLDLFNSTNGFSWVDKTGWIFTDTPCSWYGIVCTSGHVTGIHLAANGLRGTIASLPPYLTHFDITSSVYVGPHPNVVSGNIPSLPSSLEWIIIAGNQFSGSIPPLPQSLVHFNANANQLTGSIPDLPPYLEEFWAWSNDLSESIPALPLSLEYFVVDDNQLSGNIPELPQSLIYFHASYNQLSGNIPELPQSLVRFQVGNNQLTGNIPELPLSLDAFTAENNQLTGNIPELASLGALWVNDNQLTGNIPALPASLGSLRVSNNLLSGAIPTSITSTRISNYNSALLLCGGANNLYSNDPAVNAFINAIMAGWAPLNACMANQTPTANAGADQIITGNDVSLDGTLSADPDGSIVSYSWVENGSEIATGATPTVNLAVGVHVITLTVRDNRGGMATDTVATEVVTPNLPPVVNPDSVTFVLGRMDYYFPGSDLLANDSDPENASLSIVPDSFELIEGQVFHGAIGLHSNGSVGIHLSGSGPGTFNFRYQVTDGVNTVASNLSLSLTPNQPPVANPDSLSFLRGGVHYHTSISHLLANDTDPENASLSFVRDSLELVEGQDFGTGRVIVQSDGTITIFNNSSLLGTFSFRYRVTDGINTVSGTLNVTFIADQPPTANPDSISIVQGLYRRLSVSVLLANDTDPENMPLSVGFIGLIEGPSYTSPRVTRVTGDQMTISDTDYPGIYRYSYDLWDGYNLVRGTITLTVTETQPPVANEDTFTVPQQTMSMIIGAHLLLDNDSDPEDQLLTVTSIQFANPADETRFVSSFNNEIWSFTPNEAGTYPATYTVTDGFKQTTGNITLVVTRNEPPTANAGADQTVMDGDDSGGESVTLIGSLSSDSDGTISSYSWSWNGSEIATGATPTVNLGVGVHMITLTVMDNRGGTATDTVTITVNAPPPDNIPPQLTTLTNQLAVTRGSLTVNIGTYRDPDADIVMITSSIGTVVKTGSSRGLWLWNYTVPRSTPRGTVITVTITATDAQGARTTRSFVVRVL